MLVRPPREVGEGANPPTVLVPAVVMLVGLLFLDPVRLLPLPLPLFFSDATAATAGPCPDAGPCPSPCACVAISSAIFLANSAC